MYNWKSCFYLQLPKIVSKGSPKTPNTQSNFWFRGHFDFPALLFASSSSNSSLSDWFFQSIVMICSVSFSDYFLAETNRRSSSRHILFFHDVQNNSKYHERLLAKIKIVSSSKQTNHLHLFIRNIYIIVYCFNFL